MSREVRRVPMGWQHPMEWQEAWNFRQGRMKMQLLPKPMLNGSDYKPQSLLVGKVLIGSSGKSTILPDTEEKNRNP